MLTKETCQLLREPTFDNWQWDDEEMLVLLQQMYLDLELPKKFDIEISILRNFLVHVVRPTEERSKMFWAYVFTVVYICIIISKNVIPCVVPPLQWCSLPQLCKHLKLHNMWHFNLMFYTQICTKMQRHCFMVTQMVRNIHSIPIQFHYGIYTIYALWNSNLKNKVRVNWILFRFTNIVLKSYN